MATAGAAGSAGSPTPSCPACPAVPGPVRPLPPPVRRQPRPQHQAGAGEGADQPRPELHPALQTRLPDQAGLSLAQAGQQGQQLPLLLQVLPLPALPLHLLGGAE